MKRIVIVGSSCAGKSTFAKQLSQKLNYNHIELDELNWLPNWQERTTEEFRLLVAKSVEEENWVLDGNYSVTKDITWPLATDVVWLNFSFRTVLSRALFRSVTRVVTQKKLFSGNVESFRRTFLSKNSILWWVITTYHQKKARYPAQLRSEMLSQANVHILETPAEAERWLTNVGKNG